MSDHAQSSPPPTTVEGRKMSDHAESSRPPTTGEGRKMTVFDKSLTATANLVRLLPTGTTLVFQTLAPSFTNHGVCYPVNRVFSWGLIVFLFSVCAFLSFTDSIIDPEDGKTYYGLALPKGFYVFNYKEKSAKQGTNAKDDGARINEHAQSKERRCCRFPRQIKTPKLEEACKDLSVKPLDFVHALFSALLFLALALDDADLQTCLLGSRMTEQWKEFLVNMPLAIGLLASFVFIIFPSTRKGIGYDVDAGKEKGEDGQQQPQPSTTGGGGKRKLFDKSLTTTANLVRLLPDGTTLAFQTLAPSFTNHGRCYPINRVFSWGLIGFLFWACAFFCFTDSITDPAGNIYYGLALFNGFYVFNYDGTKNNEGAQSKMSCLIARKRKTADFEEARKDRRVRPRDFVHALFSALVFLALAFDDDQVQTCLLGSRMTEQWKEFLVNMPLAIGFLASFVFLIFPSTRNGIGYDVDADSAHHGKKPADSAHDDNKPADSAHHYKKNAPLSSGPSAGQTGALQITVAGVRVAPSTSYELDSVV